MKKYGGQEQSYLKRQRSVKIQINEFVIGQGYVPKFEWVTPKEAERRCKYQNVFVVNEDNNTNDGNIESADFSIGPSEDDDFDYSQP